MWTEQDVPTAIIGDVNENQQSKLKMNPFSNKMMSMGFNQQIKEPTCQTGSLIDHIYVNKALKSKTIFTQIEAVYYSDHDVISLFILKDE